MPFARTILAVALSAMAIAGCARHPLLQSANRAAEENDVPLLAFTGSDIAGARRIAGPYFGDRRTALTGRTIVVDDIEDIALQDHEVVLTFDDGPMPGKTPKILDALDAHGVKATFLMVGEMARYHPDLVRQVAAHGHTIGTHTEHHANLAAMSLERSMQEIEQGRKSVAAALVPLRAQPAPFFRFPYLADTPALRRTLAAKGVVVIDPDIDSKDYFVSSPAAVKERALARLEAKGRGVILMHDIHQRTAAMLPAFLDALQARGYKVVTLVPGAPLDPRRLLLSARRSGSEAAGS
ncbi:polysaccharide deacetylase family protein [Consotaella aegiceratis]|uniref:polysaccharide deacetylase family protein n=1 Tax=Consotaella aegiceratis TaxID=3097961 RepID=UPI002F4168E1